MKWKLDNPRFHVPLTFPFDSPQLGSHNPIMSIYALYILRALAQLPFRPMQIPLLARPVALKASLQPLT